MAKGFVAGFLKRKDGTWIRHWIQVEMHGHARRTSLDYAQRKIIEQLAPYCGGEAVARRKVIFVDALCPDGRELLEIFFQAMRSEQPATDETQVP